MPVENFLSVIADYLKASVRIHEGSDGVPGDEVVSASPKIIDGEQIWIVTVRSPWTDGTEDLVVSISELLVFIASIK